MAFGINSTWEYGMSEFEHLLRCAFGIDEPENIHESARFQCVMMPINPIIKEKVVTFLNVLAEKAGRDE